MRHLVTTRATGNQGMNSEDRVVIHEDLSVVEYCKGNGHIGSREFIGEYRRDLQVNQTIIGNSELSGRKEVREPKLELVKLTRKDKRAES